MIPVIKEIINRNSSVGQAKYQNTLQSMAWELTVKYAISSQLFVSLNPQSPQLFIASPSIREGEGKHWFLQDVMQKVNTPQDQPTHNFKWFYDCSHICNLMIKSFSLCTLITGKNNKMHFNFNVVKSKRIWNDSNVSGRSPTLQLTIENNIIRFNRHGASSDLKVTGFWWRRAGKLFS